MIGCSQSGESKLRVGWAVAFAGMAQRVMVTKSQNPPQVTFLPFSAGPELNEAARAGQIDAQFIGVVPATFLFAQNTEWCLVASVYSFQQSFLVRKGTGVTKISDLKGKRIGVGFGTGAQPFLLQVLKENGLEPRTDVDVLNIAPPEQASALLNGDIDAVAAFEPVPAHLRALDTVDTLITTEHYAFLLGHEGRINKKRAALEQLLMAFRRGVALSGSEKSQIDAEYSKLSGIPLSSLAQIKEIPQLSNVELSEEVLSKSQPVADQMFNLKLIARPVSLRDRICSLGE